MVVQKCIWLIQLLQNLHQSSNYVVELYCDNQSAIKIVENPIFHARTKRVEVHYHFIKEKALQGHIEIKYIKTEDQVADILKGLSGLKFEDFKK